MKPPSVITLGVVWKLSMCYLALASVYVRITAPENTLTSGILPVWTTHADSELTWIIRAITTRRRSKYEGAGGQTKRRQVHSTTPNRTLLSLRPLRFFPIKP